MVNILIYRIQIHTILFDDMQNRLSSWNNRSVHFRYSNIFLQLWTALISISTIFTYKRTFPFNKYTKTYYMSSNLKNVYVRYIQMFMWAKRLLRNQFVCKIWAVFFMSAMSILRELFWICKIVSQNHKNHKSW